MVKISHPRLEPKSRIVGLNKLPSQPGNLKNVTFPVLFVFSGTTRWDGTGIVHKMDQTLTNLGVMMG